MASEYERRRQEKISQHQEILEELGLREILPVETHVPKRKASPPQKPRLPVRKSERIQQLEQKRELENLKKRRTSQRLREQSLKTKQIITSQEKQEIKKDPNYVPKKKITERAPKKRFITRLSDILNIDKQSLHSSVLPPPEALPSHLRISPQLGVIGQVPVQRQVEPITVDTEKMFSPIKEKVKDEREYDDEWYTEDDLMYLGSCKQRYPYMNIAKVADINGTLCHQCLQRTRDVKTTCSNCNGPNGIICGQCLQTRYGENILEEFQKGKKWQCPSCRGICNCNACREMKNLQPIGAVCVNTLGYPSVAHWIMYTHLRK